MSVEVVLLGICVGRGCDVSRVGLGGRRDVRSLIGVSPNLIGVKGHITEIGVEDPCDSKMRSFSRTGP